MILTISIIFSLIVRTIYATLISIDSILDIISESIKNDTILYSAWILMAYLTFIMLPQWVMLYSLNHGISQKQDILETQAHQHPLNHNSNHEEE